MEIDILMNDFLIDIQNLSVNLNNTDILNKISLKIKKNLISCIIGPSGAGKTTLLRAIVRLTNHSGKIWFNNTLNTDFPVSLLRKSLVYVPQIPTAFPGTVYENISWSRSVWKIPISYEKIKYYLDLVGLDLSLKNKSAETLSVGQLQKLSLARALSIEPDALLLDEPASALDVMSKESFEELILTAKKSRKDLTIILVTHDLQQARRIADEVFLFHNGSLLFQDSAQYFFSKLESETEIEFFKNIIGKK
ncbi:MAG: ATP-binding cassette domain-containing protein [Candidatus Hodarchaeales archaeon]|jgi:ABC-type multidrug transport system ATPase subunit